MAIENDLRRAAREWIEQHGDPFTDDHCPTSQNTFLPLAETAFLTELMAWREIHNPPVPPEPKVPSSGFHVYRLWAADGRLLYVGSSMALRARLKRHRDKWGDLIASVTWDEYDDARSMLDAERLAIQSELPALNRALV